MNIKRSISLCILVSLGLLEPILGKEWPKKMTSKEKEKLALWSQQKKTIYSKVKDSNPSKEEKLLAKIAEKEEEIGKSSTERAEIDNLCLALDEESLPEFFVKFGIETGLIENVATFRKWMKANSYSAVTSDAKSKKKKYRGLHPDDSSFLVQKSGSGIRNKPFKSNRLYGKSNRARARSEKKSMAPCYGFYFLSAIEAFDQEDSKPDVMVLDNAMMDMNNMRLYKRLSDIIDRCDSNPSKCPSPSSLASPGGADNCVDRCLSSTECSGDEICCPTSCNGAVCYNPRLESKYRSADGSRTKKQCRAADNFMQCLYSNFKTKVCDERN